MRKFWLILALLAFCGALASFLYGLQYGTGQPAGERWHPPQRSPVENRCAETGPYDIVVELPDARTVPAVEYLGPRASVTVPGGRHAGQPAVPLAALVEGYDTLTVTPCVGEPVTYTRQELQAGTRDRGLLFVLNQRGAIKLLDYRQETWGQLVMRPVHAIRGNPGSG